jgi:hypothetical protein
MRCQPLCAGGHHPALEAYESALEGSVRPKTPCSHLSKYRRCGALEER